MYKNSFFLNECFIIYRAYFHVTPRTTFKRVESEFFESPPTIEATIQIKDLHKHFGLVHAVRGVNLNIYPGELTALLGHNGAGKTATMSIITGEIFNFEIIHHGK